LKVYRASILDHVRLYGEMHRFLPAWMAKFTRPSRIAEQVVNHRARSFGQSKYGISRTVRVILDLLAVLFFLRYSARPGHAFGTLGLALGTIGGAILTYLLALKLLGYDIGGRPLLLTGVLLVVMAVQFITTGVLSELLARIYYESGRADGSAYIVAEWRHPRDGSPKRNAGGPRSQAEDPPQPHARRRSTAGLWTEQGASGDEQDTNGWHRADDSRDVTPDDRRSAPIGQHSDPRRA
ncbi:MAG: hypothetical protein KDK91_33405, partial [Gammaproteobacteria bacterium]|nr:hypothetical protein [Gammaproteobacteria bacterium]